MPYNGHSGYFLTKRPEEIYVIGLDHSIILFHFSNVEVSKIKAILKWGSVFYIYAMHLELFHPFSDNQQ